MNVIERMRDILDNFPEISVLHQDMTDDSPGGYALASVGDVLLSADILGGQTRQHSFMFYAVFSGINDYERIANSGFLLDLAMWLESNAGAEVTAVSGNDTLTGNIKEIKTANGMLLSLPDDSVFGGVQYQLQITVVYTLEV